MNCVETPDDAGAAELFVSRFVAAVIFCRETRGYRESRGFHLRLPASTNCLPFFYLLWDIHRMHRAPSASRSERGWRSYRPGRCFSLHSSCFRRIETSKDQKGHTNLLGNQQVVFCAGLKVKKP